MSHGSDPPQLSLVMPCFNEEEVVAETLGDLRGAFAQHGFDLEIVAVDNGSSDRTGAILEELAAEDPRLVPVRVARNEGYGHGILSGLPACSAPWIGLICADGQVDADDVARLFRDALRSPEPKLFKVRRRFRMDGWLRKLVSVTYNLGTAVLFPGLGSIDVNGNPKILPAEAVRRMQLQSKDWFLDAEIMIKARRMGLPVHETNVFARMRGGGTSNVRPTTCLEFARNLARARLGRGSGTHPAATAPHPEDAS
jgi:glycosyltransferase involved in cell wall biosynthesis